MSDSTKVGRSVADYTIGERQAGYTRVVITADSSTIWAAGNVGGAELAFENPSGTMTMANNVLNNISGYAYQPYSASDALLDPSAELGDGVTVASIYSVIAQTNITFDPLMGVDLSAPNGGEITSEYPYLSPIQRAVEAAQETAQDAYDTAEDAYTLADSASDDAATANNAIQGFQYAGSSIQINGANLMAGTVTASELQGGVISLIDSNQSTCGSMTLDGTATDYAVNYDSNGGLRLRALSGNLYESSTGDIFLTSADQVRIVAPNGVIPNSGSPSMGTSAFPWGTSYGTWTSPSDRRLKDNIDYTMPDADSIFDGLKPCQFDMNDKHHIGFIAQDVEEVTDVGVHNDGDYYGLTYTEYIALNTWKIKQLEQRIAELEAKLNGR